MNKLLRYFTLLKFSIMNPKAGIQIIQTEKQVRNDSKKSIQEFNIEYKNLEQIVNLLFPKIEFSIEDTFEKIKPLKNHIDSFYQAAFPTSLPQELRRRVLCE